MCELLNKREAAEYLRVGMSTLERYTKEGRCPKPIHLSARRVVYRKADLVAWVDACEAQEKESPCEAVA